MKNVSLLVCILAFSAPALAQDAPPVAPPVQPDGVEAPAEAVEPEPEVSEPEPEVSEPEPEVSEPVDSGSGLGTASPVVQPTAQPTAQPVAQPTQPAVEAQATSTATAATTSAAPAEEEGSGSGTGTLTAAERAASATGGQGLPWSLPVSLTLNMSADTLAPQARPTYNPLFSMSLLASPRWIISPKFSLGARLGLDVEFTDSDYTPEGRDLEWGDLQLDATFPLPWRPGGIAINASVIARLPTSQISRTQNRFLGPTARLLLIKPFNLMEGLVTGLSLSYTGWITGSDRRLLEGTAGVDGNTIPTSDGGSLTIRDVAGDSGCSRALGDAAAGASASSSTGPCTGGNQIKHQTTVAFFASLIPVTGVSINFSFAWLVLINGSHDTSYLPADQVITSNGEPLAIGDNSPTHSTHVTSLSLGVSYDFASWMTVGLSWNTLAFYPDSDATVENPFYNENTQLNLSVSFRPDALVAERRAAAAAAEAEESASAAPRTAF